MSNIDTFIHLSTEEPNQYKQKVGGGSLKTRKKQKSHYSQIGAPTLQTNH